MKKLGMLFLLCLLPASSMSASIDHAAQATHGMVVSEVKIASQVGVDILRAGGNAVDAAVAVGYALAVVNPCCGNIGGGGFMLLHFADGRNVMLNFREKAPLAASENMYLDAKGNVKPDATTKGYLSVAVPGTVLGLDTALQKYGTMTRQQVMAPAIKLAQQGYLVTSTDVNQFQHYTHDFREQPNVAAIFLKKNQPYAAHTRLIQTDLANTLKGISLKGPNYFYQGPVADAIVKASQSQGGILTLTDFKNYQVEELKPIYCTYRDLQIISAAPPSSGGITLCEILNILENFSLSPHHYRTADNVRYFVEAMRYGFADRNSKLGDPNFINNPVEQLLSKKYAYTLSEKIKVSSFAPPTAAIQDFERTDTTHYSIIDKNGNAVATTLTLNGFFGARVIADHTGFFLNDEMDDFTSKKGVANKFGLVQAENNAIKPGKRPLSAMAPTIVMKNNHLYMILGSPGGPRIITSVLLTITNVVDYGFTLAQAINAQRFHFQGEPGTIDIEPLVFSLVTTKKLTAWGYHMSPQQPWGAVEAILIDPSNGKLFGVNDKRRPAGAALGY